MDEHQIPVLGPSAQILSHIRGGEEDLTNILSKYRKHKIKTLKSIHTSPVVILDRSLLCSLPHTCILVIGNANVLQIFLYLSCTNFNIWDFFPDNFDPHIVWFLAHFGPPQKVWFSPFFLTQRESTQKM